MSPRESAQAKFERLTVIEREYESLGIIAAGMDEVGRGPLAGPVVTACVCLRLDGAPLGVDDSKKLSEKKREELYPLIKERALYCKTAWMWPEQIDEINILNATKRAMETCAAEFTGGIILIDAVEGIKLPCAHRSIIHGDATSYLIGAASIIAKVERDRYMREIDALYPGYGFAQNKGYGTAEHIRALKTLGSTPIHRRSFIKNFIGEVK